MLYYKIKYGYGKDDFHVADETELAFAIKAQGTGTVFACAEGTVAGNSIMAIAPYYNAALGYNRTYEMGNDDYAELPAAVKRDHTHFLENVQHDVRTLIAHGKANLIGTVQGDSFLELLESGDADVLRLTA